MCFQESAPTIDPYKETSTQRATIHALNPARTQASQDCL